MDGSAARGFSGLLDRHQVLCVFLALFILTWCGVGNAAIVSMLGLLLCAEGMLQRGAQVDLWAFGALAVYNLASMASSYAAYGNIAEGFAPTQMIFLVLYLLTACLEREDLSLLKWMCALWTGAVALAGIGQFAFRAAAQGAAPRLSGFLGNPNAMGMFLVLGWFALMGRGPESVDVKLWGLDMLCLAEPVVLVALALTLSMGSFMAMAAGIVWLTASRLQRSSPGEAFRFACVLLAKAVLGVGTGVLAYLAAAWTDAPWVCLLVLAYAGALCAQWEKLGRFLEEKANVAACISALGLLVAAAAVVVRPSAADTFAERLEMMASAARYLTVNPLVGVGPYQWRLLDLNDGGTYFNTWHVHNALLHVAVELGWIAAAALAAAVVRGFVKKGGPEAKAGLAAFCVHNLMDTSFFYTGITALALLSAGSPRSGGRKLSGAALKLLFGVSAAVFAFGFYHSLSA